MELANPPVNLESLTTLGVQYGVRVVGALVALAVAWMAAATISRLVRDAMERTNADGTVTSFVGTSVRWSIRGLGLLLSLGAFGIEATSLAALLGGAGVAIGIALKGNLSNLASGLILLAFRPFRDGDLIEIGDRLGHVKKLGLMQTELDTFDMRRHWIPNSQVVETGLTNHTHHDWRRLDLDVGVAYDTDLDHATAVLVEVVDELTDPECGRDPVVRATAFGASSIDFLLGVWVPAQAYYELQHDLVLAVKRALDDADIAIPFPQRDLHIRTAQALHLAERPAAK